MKQLFSGILYCHNMNIVHRDLKPENLMMDGEQLKIIDFGTSAIFNPNKKLQTKFGTPYYTAPEVMNGYYDSKIDMWSCGVILYIMLCGSPPFYGNNEFEVFERAQSGRYDLTGPHWDEVSQSGKDLIRNLIHLNPQKRYSA